MGIKAANQAKARGVVYTPEWLVDVVLDQIPESCWLDEGWAADFSCGDGAFLERMCERAWLAQTKAGLSPEDVRAWCAQSLWGSDVDKAAVEAARARLDRWALRRGLAPVAWRLSTLDLLSPKLAAALTGKCSVVAGNPPYVRVQNLRPAARKAAQRLAFCAEGSTDLYLACYELGLRFLTPQGRLSFVAPNSWLRAKAGRAMRAKLAEAGLARAVIDFGDYAPFDGVGAYCAVASLGRACQETFEFFEWDKGAGKAKNRKAAGRGAWLADPPIHGRERGAPATGVEPDLRPSAPLGELCRLGVGFATLADSVFISDEAPMSYDKAKGRCAFHKDGQVHWLETAFVSPLVKASTSKPPKGKPSRWIIHPYRVGASGRPELVPEGDLKKAAPLLHAYLASRKKALLARDKGKINSSQWHGYGRSQGLSFSFGAWAAAPSLARAPEFFEMPKSWRGLRVAFVSGLGVGFDAPPAARAKMMATLNSPAMAEHMRWAGADYAGGYKSYNKNAVQTLEVEPSAAGVLWFSTQEAFARWAATDEARASCPRAWAAAAKGEQAKAWAAAKAVLGDALRMDGEASRGAARGG